MLEMGRLICTALYGYDYRIYGVPGHVGGKVDLRHC